MVTFVPISDPKIAEEMRIAGLLCCRYPKARPARTHWDWFAVKMVCSQCPSYFCYAVED